MWNLKCMKWHWERSVSGALRCPPIRIIPTLPHRHWVICHRRLIILAFSSVVNTLKKTSCNDVVRGSKPVRLKIVWSKVARNKERYQRQFDKKIQNLQLEEARSINRDDDDEKDDQSAVTIIQHTRAKTDRELSSPRTACLWKPLTSETTVTTEVIRQAPFRLLSFVANTARQLYVLTGRDFTVIAPSRRACNKSSQCHHTQYVQPSNISNSSVVRMLQSHKPTPDPRYDLWGHLLIGTVTLLSFTPVWISGLCSRAVTQIYATDRKFFFFTTSTNFGPTKSFNR